MTITHTLLGDLNLLPLKGRYINEGFYYHETEGVVLISDIEDDEMKFTRMSEGFKTSTWSISISLSLQTIYTLPDGFEINITI